MIILSGILWAVIWVALVIGGVFAAEAIIEEIREWRFERKIKKGDIMWDYRLPELPSDEDMEDDFICDDCLEEEGLENIEFFPGRAYPDKTKKKAKKTVKKSVKKAKKSHK